MIKGNVSYVVKERKEMGTVSCEIGNVGGENGVGIDKREKFVKKGNVHYEG